MIPGLPEAFLNRMQSLLKDEYEAFAESYHEPRYYGLRVNALKLAAEEFEQASPFALEPIPWVSEGYYYTEEDRPGKHPYYHAGLYYIQEPSAMAPVEQLGIQPGDKVLDLCAAPGGKSTQIAAKLQGSGLLVTNDNASERVKALTKNVEMAGIRNAIVLNETPERLRDRFAGYFDKILIDAPCSGEGMFRKEPDMAKQWEKHSVEKCTLMQADILEAAVPMLAPGGTLVYSTCTFSPEENEARIASVLETNPDLSVVPIDGFAHGRPDWVEGDGLDAARKESLRGTARIWPHRVKGEGHYVALLRRNDSSNERSSDRGKGVIGGKLPSQDEQTLIRLFAEEHLTMPLPMERIVTFGSYAYLTPDLPIPGLQGLKVSRPGWFLGTLKPKRFEPSHAFALGLRKEEAARRVTFAPEDPDLIRYLKGETLSLSEERLELERDKASKGYVLICVNRFPVGWGKWQQGMIKNEYPAGWRWT